MPIPLGILAVAGAGAGAAGAYDLLETVTLGSDTSSITFSNLNNYSTYKHLQFRGVVQGAGANFWALRMNGSSATEYSYHNVFADGGSGFSQNDYNQDWSIISHLPLRGNESNTFLPFVADVLDFSNSTKNKNIRMHLGLVSASITRIGLYEAQRANTAALTSLTFLATNDNFSSGSRISLYGIKG